jgi:diguanylate cyclase (GGDEF)-like protein/PAS domain S-box-containing protein
MKDFIEYNTITFDERFEYDKLSFYYISLPIILVGHLLGSLLLSAMQMMVIELRSIGIWLLLNIIIFLYRLYHYSIFKKESEKNKLRDAVLWLDRYYTDVLVSGIVWGSSAFLLFPEGDILNQAILLLFLFAIGFSSLGVLATKSDLLITYVLVMYGPILWRLFTLGEDIYITMGYAVMSLVLLMMLAANYYGRVINKSLQNRQHFIDIKASHEKLKERFFSLFERAPVGIYYYNEDLKLQDVNVEFMHMNRTEEKNTLINLSLYEKISENKILEAHKNVFNGRTGNYRGPFRLIAEKSANLFVELSTVPMLNSAGEVAGGITIVNDITSEITAQEKMMRNAYYDMLTNIPNRTLLMDKLRNLIEAKHTIKNYGALFFLDIDNFKKINTTFGHDMGDNVIKQVAHLIETVTGNHEILARVGGDKFVILSPNVGKHEQDSKELSSQFVKRLNDAFNTPIKVAGKDYHLSFSIGIVLFSETDATAFDLLKRAETAMYKAKRMSRGSMQFYQDSMSLEVQEQLMLENDIHKAVENDEFEMYYQPQMNVLTNEVIGAEALIRWNHPKRGIVTPDTFIPLAEESGIIIKIEEWVFNRIFKDTKEIVKKLKGFPLHHLAINVSTIHFMEPHFVEKLMLLVKKYDVRPEWFELEITESGIMRNIDEAIAKIKELKHFGFTFSIDDFGTGYSSLSYLKELPVDVIKIDQSFVRDMNENDKMIIEAVVAIGQKFQLKIVAEGVDSNEILSYLKNIKCDTYQGYLAHRPIVRKEFEELLDFNIQ